MNRHRLPPPPPACLVRATPSSQKGGTLIAEDVTDWATHQRRLCDPDGYRPDACPRCLHPILHVHDYRSRRLRDEAERPAVTVVRHRCAHPDCRATWLVLPLLIARHLWRSWSVVDRAVFGRSHGRKSAVPGRTRRRWRARLRSGARKLVTLLATSGHHALDAIAHAVGLDGTRGELLELRLLMSEAGFRNVDINRTRRSLRLPAPADFLWQYIQSTPLGGLVATATDRQRRVMTDEVCTRWQEHVACGQLTLDLEVTTVRGSH